MIKKSLLILKNWKFLFALGFLAAGGLGVLFWMSPHTGSASSSAEESTYETFSVKRGDLSISVSGSGTVITEKTADLGFPVEGKVASVTVDLGDRVASGQTLATLDGIKALQLDVENKQLELQTARKELEDLKGNTASASLAQALADRAQVQSDLVTAKSNLHARGDSRCDPNKIITYYFDYLYASGRVNTWQSYLDDGNTGYGTDFILTTLRPMKQEQYYDYVNMTWCEGYTDQEILTSQSNLSMAEAALQAAEKKYQNLLANSGTNPKVVEISEVKVKNAELQVDVARNNLEDVTIISPMAGTVTVINGDADQIITKDDNVFMTVADLDHPLVRVNIDQSDLPSIVLGSSAQVTFDALPGRSFTGTLTQIMPAVASVNSVNVIQGLVVLDSVILPSGKVLPVGLNANVEMISQKADNVLIIPLESLYQPAGQSAYVYVLKPQGEPEKREVEVGLIATAFVEIKSGIEEGEKVITTPTPLP
jgi:HlyD family secretion protein